MPVNGSDDTDVPAQAGVAAHLPDAGSDASNGGPDGAPGGLIPRLELVNVTRRFTGVTANAGVSLKVYPGEIHAVLGENGAGKSTLMKIIYGLLRQDEGTVLWDNKEVVLDGPVSARQLGMGMVLQHFSLFETMTVAQNVALSVLQGRDWAPAQVEARIRDSARDYGLYVDPQRYVHSLSVGEKQRVEVLRCLLHEQELKLLIMDEPTSVLTPDEVKTLFGVLRQLRAQGCAILFISHKLEEVRSLCDRVTVLRAGRVVAARTMQGVSTGELARLMVGEELPALGEHVQTVGAADAAVTPPLLRVEAVSREAREPHGVSLDEVALSVAAGSIVGVAGVSGNGQKALLGVLSGELRPDSGRIELAGRDVTALGVAARRRLGLRYVPEERLGKGSVEVLSLEENALLTRWQEASRFGLLDFSRAKHWAETICREFRVKAAGIAAPAQSLSGGNLQKYIMGREILAAPAVLIVAQPTWGVDVAAARRIHEALLARRDAGAAILLISDDLDELLTLSDRLHVINNGRLREAGATRDIDMETLGRLLGAGEQGEVSDAA